MGRDALIERIHELEAKLAASEKLAGDLYDNLTAVQARCTSLLNANRLEKHFEEHPADAGALLALAWATERARAKYPEGCTALSLLDEAGEVAHALNKRQGMDRVRDELLDVACVAMRLWMGEVDVESVLEGLAQRERSR